MIKYGIIGCGNISRFHFHGIEKAGAKVTYIADINEAAAKPWIEKTGARYTKDDKELVDSDDVDVVSILTNTKFHKEMALYAIAKGKAVVCEKTMANNGEEAWEIAQQVQKAGTLFFTTYMKRFFPAVVKGKELYSKLGRVISAQVRSYQSWGDFFTAPDLGWAEGVTKSFGGAILKCAGSHMLDMTMNFLGKPQSVYANIDYFPQTDFDRRVTAVMRFADNIAATFETIPHPLSKIGYERNSWDEKIEINGTGGRLEIYTVMWDAPENNCALLKFYDNETQTETEYRFDAVNPFDIELCEITKAVERGEQIAPSVVEGYRVDELIAAIEKSAKLKAEVDIDWKI